MSYFLFTIHNTPTS